MRTKLRKTAVKANGRLPFKVCHLGSASKPRGQPNPLLAMFRDEANYSSATCGTLDNGIGSNTFCWMTPVAVTWLERSVKRPFRAYPKNKTWAKLGE